MRARPSWPPGGAAPAARPLPSGRPRRRAGRGGQKRRCRACRWRQLCGPSRPVRPGPARPAPRREPVCTDNFKDIGRWRNRLEPGAPELGWALRGCPGSPWAQVEAPRMAVSWQESGTTNRCSEAPPQEEYGSGRRCVLTRLRVLAWRASFSPHHFPNFIKLLKRQKLCLTASYKEPWINYSKDFING